MESILFGSALRKTQKPESWGTEHLGISAFPEDPPTLSCYSDNRTFKIDPYSFLREQ